MIKLVLVVCLLFGCSRHRLSIDGEIRIIHELDIHVITNFCEEIFNTQLEVDDCIKSIVGKVI